MPGTSKLFIVNVEEDSSLPAGLDVSLIDLREAILNDSDLIIESLRSLIQTGAAATTPGTSIQSFPLDTPIFKMLPPDKVSLLPQSALALTKEDLFALGGIGVPRKEPSEFGLTVEDVKTIQNAFADLLAPGGVSGLASMNSALDTTMTSAIGDLCCCCCPSVA
jgi:hypothetical protein